MHPRRLAYPLEVMLAADVVTQFDPLLLPVNLGVVVFEPRHSNDRIVAAQQKFDKVDAIGVSVNDEAGIGYQRSGFLLAAVG